MHKKQFILLVEMKLDIKYGKDDHAIQRIKEEQKKEEIEKILNKSQSVSFHDLMNIRNITRIIFCAMFLTCNMYIGRIIYKNVFSKDGKNSIASNIFNQYFLGGFLTLMVAKLSNTAYFAGRRISLILFLIVLIICWNIVWISFSGIVSIENTNELDKKIMKRVYFYE